MATAGNGPEEEMSQQLARVIDNQLGQVHALAEAGCLESERVTGLEQHARQIQDTAAGLAQRQGRGASTGGDRYESNWSVG